MGVDDLLADFLTEVNEGLPELDNAVVRLEQVPDDEQTLSLIFRHVHTIKGTCGFLGLPRLERVAHAAEDVLGRLRDRKLKASGPIISHILSALVCIKRIVDALDETGKEPEGNDLALITARARARFGPTRPSRSRRLRLWRRWRRTSRRTGLAGTGHWRRRRSASASKRSRT